MKMKITDKAAEEFGQSLGAVVKAAIRKATEPLEARVLSLEARINQIEAETATKAAMKERKV